MFFINFSNYFVIHLGMRVPPPVVLKVILHEPELASFPKEALVCHEFRAKTRYGKVSQPVLVRDLCWKQIVPRWFLIRLEAYAGRERLL